MYFRLALFPAPDFLAPTVPQPWDRLNLPSDLRLVLFPATVVLAAAHYTPAIADHCEAEEISADLGGLLLLLRHLPVVSMPKNPLSPGSVDGDLWEVQDILAQRLTLSGKVEYLVVWRSTWVSDVAVKAGPVLRDWYAARKFKTCGAMAVTLPIVRGTQLDSDCRRIRLQRAVQQSAPESRVVDAASYSALDSAPDVTSGINQLAPGSSHSMTFAFVGPRKQLGSSAKRVRQD